MRQHTILRRIKHLRTVSQCRQLTCENVNKKQLKSQYDAVVIGSGNSLRGCQLSKTNTCIIFTCIKKNDNFSKETGHS